MTLTDHLIRVKVLGLGKGSDGDRHEHDPVLVDTNASWREVEAVLELEFRLLSTALL